MTTGDHEADTVFGPQFVGFLGRGRNTERHSIVLTVDSECLSSLSIANFTSMKPCWWPLAVSTTLEENTVHDYYQLSPHTESLIYEGD